MDRSFVWTPDAGVEVKENSFAFLSSPAFDLKGVAQAERVFAPVHGPAEAG